MLPKGLEVLIGFTPDGLANLVEFGDYFSFLTRMLLVFGIAVELPFFLVLLNLAGVVTGAQLGRHRRWMVIGTVVFAADRDAVHRSLLDADAGRRRWWSSSSSPRSSPG